MSDIWSIIGLSSLVASVVTVVLGIVRDVLVEKHRFKRQSEAGYVQAQIRMYSQINYLVKRVLIGLYSPELFGRMEDEIKKINDIVKESSDLLDSRVLNEWLLIMENFDHFLRESNADEVLKYYKKVKKHTRQLGSIIKEITNDDLIPKYRKIVGETVPNLD